MKKIVFFSKNLRIGGMEKSLVILLNELAKFYDVTLILEHKEGCLLTKIDKKIHVIEYKISNNSNVLLRKICNFTKRLLWCLINFHKYDFSCSYATYSVICSKLALNASKNNALYIHSNYYGFFDHDEKAMKSFFKNLNFDRFSHLIFVSNESKHDFAKVFFKNKEECIVINNLIDYDGIIQSANANIGDNPLISKKYVNFLFVGRLDNSSKNIDLLIDSFKEAVNLKEDIRLLLIGTGPDEIEIKKRIKNYCLNDRIVCLGEKTNPYPYIKNCDCIVLSSKYEGYPVIYSEALVLNKPVITTIPVSDGFIDVKKYFKIVGESKRELTNAFISFVPKQIKYDIGNFNLKKIKKIKKIIGDF